MGVFISGAGTSWTIKVTLKPVWLYMLSARVGWFPSRVTPGWNQSSSATVRLLGNRSVPADVLLHIKNPGKSRES